MEPEFGKLYQVEGEGVLHYNSNVEHIGERTYVLFNPKHNLILQPR